MVKEVARIRCYGALTMTAYREHGSDQEEDAADSLEPQLAAAVVDVFVYVVVLNLFVEYLPQVLSETFTRVSLGGFFSMTLLILALLLSRAAVRRLLQRPHQPAQGQG